VTDAVAQRIDSARAAVADQLDHVHLRAALREAFGLVRFGNEWFDRQAPWRQVKEDRAAADHSMGSLIDLINAAKMLFAPFLPYSSATLHGLLGYTEPLEQTGWHFEPSPAAQLPRRSRFKRSKSRRRGRLNLLNAVFGFTWRPTALAGLRHAHPDLAKPDGRALQLHRLCGGDGGLPTLQPGDWDPACSNAPTAGC
jgi:hypothetical protein